MRTAYDLQALANVHRCNNDIPYQLVGHHNITENLIDVRRKETQVCQAQRDLGKRICCVEDG